MVGCPCGLVSGGSVYLREVGNMSKWCNCEVPEFIRVDGQITECLLCGLPPKLIDMTGEVVRDTQHEENEYEKNQKNSKG